MPGLRLTLAQAARLWALDRDRVRSLLFALVDAGSWCGQATVSTRAVEIPSKG